MTHMYYQGPVSLFIYCITMKKLAMSAGPCIAAGSVSSWSCPENGNPVIADAQSSLASSVSFKTETTSDKAGNAESCGTWNQLRV
jgi:hypothetical protein